jgi:hypothetical protein
MFLGEFEGGSSAEPVVQDVDVATESADMSTAESTVCVSSPTKASQVEPDTAAAAGHNNENESVTVTETKEVADVKQENKSVCENEHVYSS